MAYPDRFNDHCLQEAAGKKPDEVADIILQDIKVQAGNTTLLVVKENMSDVFAGLKDLGQKRLRAYLQENNHISLLCTSQKLFNGISSRDAAFWGFFAVHHLNPLGVQEASELIGKLAKLKKDQELVDFLNTSQGNYRIRALHYLAGGNHRLYIELASFLTKSSLDDFVEAVIQLADHLTPYFQERIRSLSPQQAGIVQKLCELNGAIQVKVIAEKLFLDERAVASQLKDLKAMGYVIAHKRGRAAYYEIAEPLLRLSLEVKNNHGKPLKIIASLFRAWFSDKELQANVNKNDGLLGAYSKMALEQKEILSNLKAFIYQDLLKNIDEKDHDKVIDYTSELLCSAEIIQLESDAKAATLFSRSLAYFVTGKVDLALIDLTRLIEMTDAPRELVAKALLNRSVTYFYQQRLPDCLSDLEKIGTLKAVPSEIRNRARFNIPKIYYYLLDIQNAHNSLRQAFSEGDKEADYYPDNSAYILIAIAKLGSNYWQQQMDFLLPLYAEYQCLPHLASGLMRTIKMFVGDKTLHSAFKKWAGLWHKAGNQYPEMQPAIDALNASAEALSAGNDKPLLALPKEIRALILPMFEFE